jgi:sarcosine oxidase subunit gamma
MSKYRPQIRSALADRQPITGAGISLVAVPEGSLLHILGMPDGIDLAPVLSELSDAVPFSARRVAPGQWFLIGNEPLPHDALAAISLKLEGKADVIDQSHGRIRIRVGGRMVERVLSKGTGVDLHDRVFPVGHSATCLVGHIASHLTRVDVDAFELIVLRGFAESLWDDLARMSSEYA